MTPIALSPLDLAVGASLILVDGVLSVRLGLGLHRRILLAALRMVVQLVLIGYVLRAVFAAGSAGLTLLLVALMALIAAREVGARPRQRLDRFGNYAGATLAVLMAASVTALLALTTAIRPQPWWDPHYAVPLAGIILGSVLNAASLSLDSILSDVGGQRSSIEARLALGTPYWKAIRPILQSAVRRGLLPIVNQMSAAGLITLPGIMTGQILAGQDPVEAVKYQILLMFLLAGSSGLAAASIAYFAAWRLTDDRHRLRLDRLRL